jgi:hypothetical protein
LWLAASVLTMSSGMAARALGRAGHATDPLEASPGVKGTALVFLRTDCPISNRYAPDIRRLYNTFSRRGVAFRLVYPNPNESAADVRAHVESFSLPGEVVRDPRHIVVNLIGAVVTPEAAVLDADGRVVYRGRIDDRYTDFGVDRQDPTRRDLEDAITALLAGRPVATPVTPAVGCFIADVK